MSRTSQLPVAVVGFGRLMTGAVQHDPRGALSVRAQNLCLSDDAGRADELQIQGS